MHRSEFLKIVKTQFPELRHPINQEQGNLLYEMRVFRMFTQRAISNGDRKLLAACFALALRAYTEGNGALRAMIELVFVEEMDFMTPRHSYDWAWCMLPEELQKIYVAFHSQFYPKGRIPFRVDP